MPLRQRPLLRRDFLKLTTLATAATSLPTMATELGKGDEASRWHDDAEKIRLLIISKLYSPEDAAFYDLDANNKFIRVRSDVISRVLGEHVLHRYDAKDKAIFDDIWTRQLHNPKSFWAPYDRPGRPRRLLPRRPRLPRLHPPPQQIHNLTHVVAVACSLGCHPVGICFCFCRCMFSSHP